MIFKIVIIVQGLEVVLMFLQNLYLCNFYSFVGYDKRDTSERVLEKTLVQSDID